MFGLFIIVFSFMDKKRKAIKFKENLNIHAVTRAIMTFFMC
jgi:hypothetical protein